MLWLVGSGASAILATAVLLLALFALAGIAFLKNRVLEMPSVAFMTTKEGSSMKMKAKLWFASVLGTIHGLGVNSWVSHLLPKATLNITRR